MQTRRGLTGLAGLLVAEVAGLVALLRLGELPGMAVGWTDVRGWLAVVAPADAVIAILRLAGLGCAGWLLVTTLAYTAARLVRSRRGWSVLERLTLPVVRRVADRAVAVVLATSSLTCGAAWAAEPVLVPPGAQVVAVQDPAHGAVAPDMQGGAPDADVVPPGAEAVPPDATPRIPRDADVWVVAEGDHLWGIARALLVAERPPGAPPPADREVHARWLALLEANDGRLASGDPDRIFPGEELLVPRDAGLTPPGAAGASGS